MTGISERRDVRIDVDGLTLAAWHYPGTSGACVVMTGGLAVTRGPGTDRFAARFHEAGYSVLAFDHRRLGDSGGSPRQVVRARDSASDWRAVLHAAARLPEVDPGRVAAWAFSQSGGVLLDVASRGAPVAAVVAQTPNADGLASLRSARRYQLMPALARLTARGLADAVGARLGRPPRLVPLVGVRGSVALLANPDVLDTDRALDPEGRYVDWPRTVAARFALGVAASRPGRRAGRIEVPLLVVVADDDLTALAEPSVRAAERAPRGELVRVPGGHYAPFLDQHETVVRAELAFLDHHLAAARAEGCAAAGGQRDACST